MVRSRFIIAGLLLLAFVGSAWAGECRLFAPSDRTKCMDFSIQTRYVGEADFSGVGASTLSVEDDLGWGFNLGYSSPNVSTWAVSLPGGLSRTALILTGRAWTTRLTSAAGWIPRTPVSMRL